MADNVAITPGAGAAVSTEEVTTLNGESVAAQHVQRVIVAVRTDDEEARDVMSGSSGLPVKPYAEFDNGMAIESRPLCVSNDNSLHVELWGLDSGIEGSPRAAARLENGALCVALGGSLPPGSNEIGTVVIDTPVLVMGQDPMEGSRSLHVDAAGDLQVDVLSGPTGASALQVQGTVAHDAAAANNPVLGGGYAVNAEPTAVANGDVARLVTDLVGKLIALPYANPENFVAGKTAAITDTTRTAVIAAPGAGVRHYVTHLLITNSHATVGTYVKVEDGTTEIYGGYAAPAGGGFSVTLPVPLRLSANTALNVTCATTGANVYASASGYKGV